MSGSLEAMPYFLLLGGSLAAGWIAHEIFRRWRVSDILVLLLIGLAVGPLLGFVDPTFFKPAARVLAPLALAIVLFEAGLDLRIADVGRAWGAALALTLLAFSLGTLAVAGVMMFALGYSATLAIMFGLAVSATGILGVVPLLNRLGAPPRTRVLLTLETSLGDLLSAVAVTALASWVILDVPAYAGVVLFGAKLAIGAAVGLVVGFAWARALHEIDAERFGFALTLATLMVAYAATELLNGSGYFMALTFGLIVGNAGWLMRAGEMRDLAAPPERARLHTGEVVFVLRSTFFVFLGLSVPREALTPTLLAVGAAFLVALAGSRILAVWLAGKLASLPEEAHTRVLLVAMMPRGLATAVIAGIPAAMGVPGSEMFVTLVFVVIVAADIAATIGIHAYERRVRGTRADAAAPEAQTAKA